MDEARAREIASWWHGGQWSALYAFCSTGTRRDDLLAEVEALIGLYAEGDLRQLNGLYAYLRGECD